MKLVSDAWILAKKDIAMYVRDRSALCLGFLVPIALVTVFGWIMTYAFGGGSGIPKITLWYVDEDQSERSNELVKSLRSSEMIKLLPAVDDKPLTAQQLRDKIVDGDAHHGIIIPKGYDTQSEDGKYIDIKLIRDPGRMMEDRMIQIALMQGTMMNSSSGWTSSVSKFMRKQGVDGRIVEQIQSSMNRLQTDIESAFDEKEQNEASASSASNGAENESKNKDSTEADSKVEAASGDPFGYLTKILAVETEDIKPPTRSKQVGYQQAQSVSGMSVMMLLFGLTGAGSLLITEKDSGTLRRLFALPIARESVLLGKFFFVSILGITQMVVLFVYGELMFRVGLFRDPFTLVLLLVTWVAAAGSFAMFIATFSKSAKQADSLATILILGMAALGGCWFPLQLLDLPAPMVVLTRSMMTYWAMDGLQSMIWNNLSWVDGKIIKAILIQWIWAGALAVLAGYFFRRNYIPR